MLEYLYKEWPKIGFFIAIYTGLILLANAKNMPCLTLLIWLQFPVYLLHEFEEHAYPGKFKEFINKEIFRSKIPDFPLNAKRVFWINILFIWIMFPCVALLSQLQHVEYGLLLPFFGMFNATTHIACLIIKRKYNPGLFVSVFLNYPTGYYTLKIAHNQGVLNLHNGMIALLACFLAHLAMVLCIIYWDKKGLKKTNV